MVRGKSVENIPICTDCFSKFKSIYKNLEKDELDNLTYEKGCSFYKKGTIIFHEGNRINGVYCVNSGIIKMYKTGSDGKEQIISFGQKGSIIGYRSIISSEVACTSAKVIEEAILCFIPATTFLNFLKNNTEFSMELIQLSCKELGEANKFILDIAQKTVRERLAEILLLLKDTFGLDANNVLQVSLTREELANIVGTATESVIRLLSEFKQNKVIELNGRKIKFINEKGLKRISNIYAY